MRNLSAAVCLIILICASPSLSDYGVAFGNEVPQPDEDLAYDLGLTIINIQSRRLMYAQVSLKGRLGPMPFAPLVEKIGLTYP